MVCLVCLVSGWLVGWLPGCLAAFQPPSVSSSCALLLTLCLLLPSRTIFPSLPFPWGRGERHSSRREWLLLIPSLKFSLSYELKDVIIYPYYSLSCLLAKFHCFGPQMCITKIDMKSCAEKPLKLALCYLFPTF